MAERYEYQKAQPYWTLVAKMAYITSLLAVEGDGAIPVV